MKWCLLHIAFFIVFHIPEGTNAQVENFDALLDKVEHELLGYNPAAALQTIDSVLLKVPINASQKSTLKAIKVQALVSGELYDEALVLSSVVLRLNNYETVYRIRVFLQRALLYEILGKLDKAEVELNDVSKLYEDPATIRDDIYGEYLYRLSSFHRVKGEEAIALEYAQKSYEYGLKHNYKSVMAVSSMLIGFLSDNLEVEAELEYYNRALQIWKSFGDYNGMASMYAAISRINRSEGNMDLAFKYNDSLLRVTNGGKDFYFQGYGFLQRSELFEQIEQKDSALYYFKLYKEANEAFQIYKKDINVSQLDYHYKLEKEAILRDNAVADLELSKRYNATLWIILFALGLALLVVGFLLRKIMYRNKRINEQNEEVEQVNTTLSKTVEQKEILLQELNHRVKNNLSLILSLINFQQEEVAESEKEKFQTLQNRIETIALAHEQFIYNEQQVGETKFDLSNYLSNIANSLVQLRPDSTVYNQFIPSIRVTIDTAMPMGILVNELINNSIKHAQPNGGQITMELTIDKDGEDTLFLHYKDTGTTFTVVENSDSLGLFIIESMIAQLDGTYTREGSEYKCELKIK